MPLRIPLDNGPPNVLPFFDVQVDIDGGTYTLQLRWNVRLAAWFLTVLDEEGATVLIGDSALRVGGPVKPYFTGRIPAGAFVPVDTSGGQVDPGYSDLGVRVQLDYFTATELGL
jgi:hypothetical protein